MLNKVIIILNIGIMILNKVVILIYKVLKVIHSSNDTNYIFSLSELRRKRTN